MVHVHTEKCTCKLAEDCASFQAYLQPLDRSRAPRLKQTGLALGSEMSGVKRKRGHEAVQLSLPIKLKAFIMKSIKTPSPLVIQQKHNCAIQTQRLRHTNVTGWSDIVKIVGKEYTVL